MAFLDHIRACNTHDLGRFVPLVVAGVRVGWVRRDHLPWLAEWGKVFEVGEDSVWLCPALATPEDRTQAVAEACVGLAERHGAPRLKGEWYRVAAGWNAPVVMNVDRALVSLFGVRAYGIHVNGVVADVPESRQLWIARRAADRAVAPGKLDNMIAGGQPAELGLMENLLKEAAEEADVGPDLARTARPVGAISYCHEDRWGLKPDTMFCFDLSVPVGFAPRNTDGEIEDFRVMEVTEIAALVRDTDAFKFNVNLVLVDFLVRHGYLNPDDEPDYVEIVRGLRQGAADF
ncbi:DUF4743 domain-containing protein [Magnetospirillum aberrantis]|uniref:DUF4743 domain-containing protein n=1 Tax=Magnetospirillum aberrantis SpK TaxID=908842 RepID=A0A7C9V1Q8_9PROT|nr:DUF4743 domain-containing protein [Magnetospirillum aberrantis]NFV82214.1 DUF4743 domain-containing protein [Magnetospirillum aberrantis SpK]